MQASRNASVSRMDFVSSTLSLIDMALLLSGLEFRKLECRPILSLSAGEAK